MKTLASLILAAATTVAALPASAQFAKPEDAVKYRQSAMTLMGAHLSRVGAMANGRVPFDAKVALENIEVLNTLARLPHAGFIPGTEKLSPKTKPEIWTEAAKFKEQSDKLVAESGKLLAAAKTNNLDNLKAAFGGVAASCKSCHDTFRTN